ncbi:MAG: TonB-dependent receptor [Burkholderiaceae bacterium]|nr:TonB-dependent receptor [Burkholderiaceae bacterium]
MFKKSKICTGVLVAMGGWAMTAPAMAQQQLERIEVTGSRIKSISLEGTSPVAVIGEKEIKTDGVRNVESLLNNLPQVFADQGGNVVNGSTGTATVNLRGLGADRTLVLVNGRRLPLGSPTNTAADLNQIPAALIKRVEVLTGGASAVYGSDAVAGVVNFIMNDKFQGVQFDVNHSFFNHGQQGTAGVAGIVAGRAATNAAEFKVPGDKSADGKSTDISLLIGSNFADNKGNATLFFSYKKDDALLQSERDFSACSLSASAAGFACGGSGTNATGTITNLTSGLAYTNGDRNGTARRYVGATDQYNFGPINHYQRPSERYGFNASANYELTDTAKVYGEFSFHDDLTVAQIAPGGAFGSVHTANFDNPLLSASWKAALGLVNPGDSTDYVLQRRNVEGGGRQSEFRNTSFRGVVGVKGEIGKWSYDAFAIRAKVIYSQNENNYFLSPRIDRAMDVVNVNGVATCASVVNGSDPSCVPYNPWLLGGVTPEQLNYLQTPGFRKGSTNLAVEGASLSADLGDYGIRLPGAKNGVGVAFGLEHRRDELALSTDPATAAGELSGSGGPTKGLTGMTTVNDIFGEVRVPILEGKPMAELLSANGSYRHSEYGTGTKTDTYGVGGEWAPIKAVKFRGSYQQAVRAPNVVELFQAQGNNLYDNDADPCAGATPTASLAACARTGVTPAQYGTIQDSPAGQYNYLAGGNPNLKPETAKSTTFGVVLTPMRDLAVTVDYFDIKVKDTISNIDPTTTLAKCLENGDPIYCSLITRDRLGTLWLLPQASIVGTNLNLGSTRTTGFDFGLNYGHRIGAYGSLGLSFVGTLLKKLETEEIKGQGTYDCVGLYGPNKCGSPNPEWRHKIRGNWASPWGFDLSVTWRHLSKVTLQTASDNPLLKGTPNAVERELAAQNYLDLAGSWKVTKGLTLSGGINNLLDKDPPITSQLATGAGNGNTYPSVYDALGRKIFLSATYKF